MRPIPVDPPAVLQPRARPLARLAFFGVLSLALLFADTRYRYLENVRQVVAIALYPVQRALQMPGEAFAYVADYFGRKRELADENAMLKQELVAQRAGDAGLSARRRKRTRGCRRCSTSRAQYAATATAVEVLYTSRDPFTQKVFVDKGVERRHPRRRGRRSTSTASSGR